MVKSNYARQKIFIQIKHLLFIQLIKLEKMINAKSQIIIRLKYIFIFKFLFALTSGLIINFIRIKIFLHHYFFIFTE